MFTINRPFLIGMVHLAPLPGSPRFSGSLDAVQNRAVEDAQAAAEAGFDAVLIENYGDVPFIAGRVEPLTIAAMTKVAQAVRDRIGLPLGINVLRNDPVSALGIAACVGGQFIRVNLHLGVAATDQGILEGQADRTLRLRQHFSPHVAIFADVHVKHAVTLSQPDIALSAEETAYRGMADALIVSGPTTGRSAEMDDLRRVKTAVPDRPLLIGSGATAESIRELLRIADGVIVGTAIKADGDTEKRVDVDRARAFVRAARG